MTLHENKSEIPELPPQNGEGTGIAVEIPETAIPQTDEKSLKKSPVSPEKKAFYQKTFHKGGPLWKTGLSDYDPNPCHSDPDPCNHDLNPCRQQLERPTYFSRFFQLLNTKSFDFFPSYSQFIQLFFISSFSPPPPLIDILRYLTAPVEPTLPRGAVL